MKNRFILLTGWVLLTLLGAAPLSAVGAVYESTDTPIEDSTTNRHITSTLSVADSVVITDLNVGIEYEFGFFSVATATLTSPAGTSVVLFAARGFPGQGNLNIVLDDDGPTHTFTGWENETDPSLRFEFRPGDSTNTGTYEALDTSLNPSDPTKTLAHFNNEDILGNWILSIPAPSNNWAGTEKLTCWRLFVNEPGTVCPTAGSNLPPTAVAGDDQDIRAGDTVNLDGGASFDDNTAPAALVYAWSFSSIPMGSSATLNGADTATPDFTADVAGTYIVQLIVTDEGSLDSAPDEVIVSSDNLAPTADAGVDQLLIIGETANLDGTGSSDPEMDPLTYLWMLSAPAGSAATLSDAGTATPSFVTDVEGVYEVTLAVSDAVGPSGPDVVVITAATAGAFAETQIVSAGDLIAGLSAEQVTTGGNQNAIGSFLSQAVLAIQAGDVATAIDKLQKTLARTDGCVLRGSPDGNGPGKDWVTDCMAQFDAYAALNAALEALTP